MSRCTYKVVKAQVIFLLVLNIVGCANFLKNLRQDIDDPDFDSDSIEAPGAEPTVGGRWSERRYLEASESESSGRGSSRRNRGRSLASNNEDEGQDDRRSGLFDDAGRNYRREALRDYPSSASVPVVQPEVKRLYKNGNRATRDDFIDQSQEEGSLWASSGQTNYYFTKNRIRSPGDLISLNVENDLFRDIGIEIKKSLSSKEKANELAKYKDQMRAKYITNSTAQTTQKDSLPLSAAAPERTPTPGVTPGPSATPAPQSLVAPDGDFEKAISKLTFEDVNINPSIDFKMGETMMGEIIERFPNGNYKVRTVKRIPYKKGTSRLVNVVGIVKPTDINEETDVINSGKMYEYRVEVSR